MATTWAAYLIKLGIKTVLLIGGDKVKLETQKKLLLEENPDSEVTVLIYQFDFSKRLEEAQKQKIIHYITKLMAENENHCSILVNNIALSQDAFKQLAPMMIGNITNIKITNHSFITRLLMITLRN